ncbi:FAD-binding domain-containing protein [Novosphingobium sp. SG720]|uniref:FAD-binding domain-containing protein n=1 Tax=Novosphingobium sp. SG720 TaxID=2586998 RepID=UPI001445BD46|nr:FAD-binding domain-containing protein [Novosphingobium sp. SG720]NKJ41015.1 deoxyribodipyrimidine photo-lyase [Novosphingobium sp. SG720]
MASAPTFPVTRADALFRLAQFVPLAGAAYAKGRNFDCGPGQHDRVSRLSAALRRRTISEGEVVQAVRAEHGPEAAASFISEVFWRTYWKGWLEQRPAIWTRYLAGRDAARQALLRDPDLAGRHGDAVAGHTGIDAFDHWMGELGETGYLHNWARMQVASIWIFTLGLPWELGAAHMLDRLRDGDPASNTLSWRWVAGLHTAGKAYLADGVRIAAMTGGRFAPQGLATQATIPVEAAAPPAAPWRTVTPPDPAVPALAWITPEDAGLEQEATFAALPLRGVVACRSHALNEADRAALTDGLARAADRWQVPAQWIDSPTDLGDAAQAAGTRQIVTGYIPAGPLADALPTIRATLQASGLGLAEHLRHWDKTVWPHCRRGFFALKQEIPALLKQLA